MEVQRTGRLCLILPEKLVARLRAMDDPNGFATRALECALGVEGTPAEDELFDEAVELVLREGRGSTSLIQRAFSVGYSRAARLIDVMAKKGVVGRPRGSSAREVLITLEAWNARHRNKPAP